MKRTQGHALPITTYGSLAVVAAVVLWKGLYGGLMVGGEVLTTAYLDDTELFHAAANEASTTVSYTNLIVLMGICITCAMVTYFVVSKKEEPLLA